MSSLGATDPGDECDSDGSYAIAKAFGFDKKVEDIEKVQEEGEQTGSGDLLEDLLLSQGESGDDLSDIEAHLGKPMAIRNKINNGMQHPESSICLSPVEKVRSALEFVYLIASYMSLSQSRSMRLPFIALQPRCAEKKWTHLYSQITRKCWL